MTMAELFESQYKYFYGLGLFSKELIASYVKMGVIDGAAYKRITGDDYVEN